ncbi:MAG: AbrB/MazE/SpoVT family DNA-binding domain-containing protein [Xenococcaceae cyanobacterium MO_207.B15]|nr:AbrB/MazE/SpoVT family DNA-binding domain-containing protein [Xenococcaceae cyanobacterium MO_207.B15]MDJ0747579.1 AbrB/MazE/SpoVT family DNA-binding domain-containing protein [Xenococcaceae cyanobacterium MO_167.B27]
METKVTLRKWGNSLGLRIPHQIAQKMGIQENTALIITEKDNQIIIQKAEKLPDLSEILDSIPEDFEYPDDVDDFVRSEPRGREII